MPQRKKAEIDEEIRDFGVARIDLEDLTQVGGNVWYGSCEVEEKERFFEIKVIAKSEKFDADTLQGLLDERAEVEERKAVAKVLADKKKAKDKAKREVEKIEEVEETE